MIHMYTYTPVNIFRIHCEIYYIFNIYIYIKYINKY